MANKQLKTIAIIDDDSDLLDLYRAILESAACHVETASSLNEGRQLLAREAVPDVIFLDCLMPGSVEEFLHELRGNPKCGKIKVVGFSSLVENAPMVKRMRAHLDDFIQKPDSVATLLSLFSHYCGEGAHQAEHPRGILE